MDVLDSFSRERLEREVVVLATERDALACQLRESTQSFQQQLTELDVASKCMESRQSIHCTSSHCITFSSAS